VQYLISIIDTRTGDTVKEIDKPVRHLDGILWVERNRELLTRLEREQPGRYNISWVEGEED